MFSPLLNFLAIFCVVTFPWLTCFSRFTCSSTEDNIFTSMGVHILPQTCKKTTTTKHFTLIQTSDSLRSSTSCTPLPSILPSRLNRSKLICKILIWGARGWGVGAHDCGRILIRTGRSSSLLYTLRSSYLHNWLMFLCEVGMNNTLVGLLHPQADEKMFNFSKCSAPAPFLSLSFSLPGYLWVLACVCEFSLVSWRLEECCWFAFFRVYCRLEVHVKHHKQKAASAFANMNE